MQRFAEQLQHLLRDPKWSIEKVRSALRVSRASLFNYKNGTDLPNFDVLKRAHDNFGFTFPFMDFSEAVPAKPRRTDAKAIQGVFPFLETLREEDIRVVDKKNVDRETLELTVQIRFSSNTASRYRR